MNLDTHFHNGDQPKINAKDLTGTPFNVYFSSSDNLRASADTEKQGEQTTYTKIKEIQVYRNGTVKVKFDDKAEDLAHSVYSALYVNGTIVGSAYTAGTSWTTRTISQSVKAGDKLQVYARTSNAATDYFIRNFRIYYDLTKTSDDSLIIVD